MNGRDVNEGRLGDNEEVRTTTDLPALLRSIEQARSDDYCLVVEELEAKYLT